MIASNLCATFLDNLYSQSAIVQGILNICICFSNTQVIYMNKIFCLIYAPVVNSSVSIMLFSVCFIFLNLCFAHFDLFGCSRCEIEIYVRLVVNFVFTNDG